MAPPSVSKSSPWQILLPDGRGIVTASWSPGAGNELKITEAQSRRAMNCPPQKGRRHDRAEGHAPQAEAVAELAGQIYREFVPTLPSDRGHCVEVAAFALASHGAGD